VPLVSVLLPVRNGERYIEEAVRSILNQTLEDIELLTVDDGSHDQTAQILERLAKADPRLILLRQAASGLVSALELARSVARGSLLARMDADDVAVSDRLERQASFLASNPHIVAVGGQIEYIDNEGNRLGFGRYPLSSKECADFLLCGVPFAHPTLMMRAKACANVGGYRAAYFPAEDHDLVLRLSREGELTNLGAVLLRYRRHAESTTSRECMAQARASALAYLSYCASVSSEQAVIPTDLIAGDCGDSWLEIEATLEPSSRLAGRAAYLRALCLNGGICDSKAHALICQSLSELAANVQDTRGAHALVFSLARGAYNLVKRGWYYRGSRLLFFAFCKFPILTVVELLSFTRERLSRSILLRAAR
jgi:Glycosyltransferases involved in cell wall biogenesis